MNRRFGFCRAAPYHLTTPRREGRRSYPTPLVSLRQHRLEAKYFCDVSNQRLFLLLCDECCLKLAFEVWFLLDFFFNPRFDSLKHTTVKVCVKLRVVQQNVTVYAICAVKILLHTSKSNCAVGV